MQIGDAVCVLSGGSIPFVLRKLCTKGRKQRYVLIEEAYVHGLMKGLAKKEFVTGKLKLVNFEIMLNVGDA